MLENFFRIIVLISTISFFLIFITTKYAGKFKLLDYPNKRKDHLKPTPFTGGIGISLTFILIIFFSDFSDNYLNLILAYTFMIS